MRVLFMVAALAGCLSPVDADTGIQWRTVPDWYAPLQGEGIQNTQWTDEDGFCLFVGVDRVSWGGLEADAACGPGKAPGGVGTAQQCRFSTGEVWTFMFEHPWEVGDEARVLMADGPVDVRRGGFCVDMVD